MSRFFALWTGLLATFFAVASGAESNPVVGGRIHFIGLELTAGNVGDVEGTFNVGGTDNQLECIDFGFSSERSGSYSLVTCTLADVVNSPLLAKAMRQSEPVDAIFRFYNLNSANQAQNVYVVHLQEGKIEKITTRGVSLLGLGEGSNAGTVAEEVSFGVVSIKRVNPLTGASFDDGVPPSRASAVPVAQPRRR